MMNPSRARALILLTACLALAGALPACQSGPPRTKVGGRLTKGGKPLEVAAMVGKVIVIFEPMDAALGPKEHAAILPDGSFTVPGPNKKGLRPGKYRVAV